MIFRAATLSKAGPRKVNEDSIGLWTKPGRVCAAVADGLGGMGGGNRASQIAIEVLAENLQREVSAESMIDSARMIHEAILIEQRSNLDFQTMATTLTAVSIIEEKMFGVHCGDTRAVIARGRGIKRLTGDHAEGERLFRAGKLTKEELMDYPRKHILDSALGMHKVPKIEGFRFELEQGDKIFLTSDGVHQIILLRELHKIAAGFDDPEAFIMAVDQAIEAKTAEDNYSIVAVFVS